MELKREKDAENRKILEDAAKKVFVLFIVMLLLTLGSYSAGYKIIGYCLLAAAFVALVATGILLLMSGISALNEELRKQD